MPRPALLAENLGKPSLWVITKDLWYYTRIARLMLVEKGIDHDYMRVANWSGYEKLPGFEDLHPFAKVPVFEHGGFPPLRNRSDPAICR